MLPEWVPTPLRRVLHLITGVFFQLQDDVTFIFRMRALPSLRFRICFDGALASKFYPISFCCCPRWSTGYQTLPASWHPGKRSEITSMFRARGRGMSFVTVCDRGRGELHQMLRLTSLETKIQQSYIKGKEWLWMSISHEFWNINAYCRQNMEKENLVEDYYGSFIIDVWSYCLHLAIRPKSIVYRELFRISKPKSSFLRIG